MSVSKELSLQVDASSYLFYFYFLSHPLHIQISIITKSTTITHEWKQLVSTQHAWNVYCNYSYEKQVGLRKMRWTWQIYILKWNSSITFAVSLLPSSEPASNSNEYKLGVVVVMHSSRYAFFSETVDKTQEGGIRILFHAFLNSIMPSFDVVVGAARHLSCFSLCIVHMYLPRAGCMKRSNHFRHSKK